MNFYPAVSAMSHPPVLEHPRLPIPPQPFTHPPNRFIYVKHNFVTPQPALTPKVLVNPHFKKKVYVNPLFKPPQAPTIQINPHFKPPSPKPKIHINPNVLKSFAKVPINESKIETKATTVISTRNKLVRIPCNPSQTRKRRNSVHTKYKIVRSGAKSTPKNCISKFKLDKRVSLNKSVKKKYVYVNRFLSMEVVAKNVLLKKNQNLCKPGFVNINGILYKKSPNSLKKAEFNKSKSKKLVNSSVKSSKYKLVRKETKRPHATSRRSLVKRYKIIRSKKLAIKSPSQLRKCNIPCPIYRKYGKCPGKETGTCIKRHNPDQIILCTRFLQGACRNENCLLSHKVSHEKMPTCKYFLEGLCSKDDCPYLHVKISPKADICRDFLEGFCKKGKECDKRHQFLCPDFEKNKKCPKRRCPYPHGNLVRKIRKVSLAKKCSTKKETVKKEKDEKNRYYQDGKVSLAGAELGEEPVFKTVARDRPKLGALPAFIPFDAAS